MNPEGIVTVIQARLGSTRLPGKVLLPLCGEPLLYRMWQRVANAALAGNIIIATTTDAQDDAVEELCARYEMKCFRGHPTDLLDRHYKAALEFPGVHTVIKIPSDCPLIDPAVIDRVIAFYLDNHNAYDFVSNLHPATYPDGNDVEIMPVDMLKLAWKKAEKAFEREHTTPYFWERPEQFRIGNITWETGKDYSMSHRFTIDYKEDYEFIKTVYDKLYNQNPQFGLANILELLEQQPGIYELNAKYSGVNWYRNHLNELKTISADQTRKEEN